MRGAPPEGPWDCKLGGASYAREGRAVFARGPGALTGKKGPGPRSGPRRVWCGMGVKSGLEYEAVNVSVPADGERWGPSPVLAKAINEMAAKGWELVSCSHPRDQWAVLAFSRPKRPAPGEGGP